MRPGLLLISAVLLSVVQIGFLTWTVTGRANVLRDGREALLKVEPIDPRDLLRGDYVILGYEVARIDARQVVDGAGIEAQSGSRPVYVALRKGADGVFQFQSAALDRANLVGIEPQDVVMRGTTDYWPGPDGRLNVTFGLERFYLPEGEGKQIEKDMRERPFFVVVAVADDGTAQIKSFRDGDKVLYDEPYY
ncbi:MAG: GDYXXLXY domain-containing protein [Mesorhizobium sp.]